MAATKELNRSLPIYLDPAVKFGFEESFDEGQFLQWLRENWTQSLWYSFLYVVFIFGGKYLMQKRTRFELRTLLSLWSFSLAIFSIFGSIRTVPELGLAIYDRSLEFSICTVSPYNGPTPFWTYMFTASKVVELGDTAFIVLRKQELIFLHWYHHISVMVYVWYSYAAQSAPARWFMVMNYVVHAFMYTYYTLRAMKIRVPKMASILLTAMQLSQMVWGLIMCGWIYLVKTSGGHCQQTYGNLCAGFLMYLSYFFLFAHFFYNAYIHPKPTVAKSKTAYTNGVNGTMNGVNGKIKAN